MNEKEFKKYLLKLNIDITEEELKKFETYKELLKEYNKKFNLTSITEDEKIYLKHFYDSLYLMTTSEFKNKETFLDIGTGAGFPGLALAIMNKNMFFTLVESNQKKCMFLNLVKEKLNLKNVEIINQRAEEYTKVNREKFDIVSSRAVSHLKILSELEIPALKVSGYFLALKSSIEEELNETIDFLKELDCTVEKLYKYELPIENSERTIVVIKKNKITKTTYPRNYSQIIKTKRK